MATPAGPRPGNFPPNFNPNSLANNMQNLRINHQQASNSGGSAAPNRPSNPSPYTQEPTPFPGNRPRPPPQGSFPRGPPPPNAPYQTTLPQNMAGPRPAGPTPASRPPPPFASNFGTGPRPGPISSYPSQMSARGPVSNGPQFSPPMGGVPRPLAGPPQPQPLSSSGTSSQFPNMRPSFSSPPESALPSMGQQAPPFSVPPQAPPFSPALQNGPPAPGSPFSAPVQGMPQSSGSPYGMQAWPSQLQQGAPAPPISGPMQQQQMFGMPLPPTSLPNQSMALRQSGQSRIELDQIPHLSPNTAVILHETRQNNQANPPPPATSEYIAKDTGNCSPRYIRCTLNQVPCTVDLLSKSEMQLALLVQPLALPHPSEEPIQVVDCSESGPVRCSRCKGYINPFMKFIDQGRKFICNLCGFTDETPHDYHCNLGPDGRRLDADERPELCRGTVEFIASKEFMVRDPMPAVFFFLIDVSMNAIQTGATAAACSAISQVISDLPEGPRSMVGIATFDSTIHFYNLKRADQQPLMLIVPDVQDVYTPLASDVIVQLDECRQHLEILLESIPTTFQNSRTADSAFGSAAKAAFLAMKSTGGKLLVFQSILPSTGIGSLAAREEEGRAGEKDAHKLLQPADIILKTMAIEFAEYQVCVDLFITTQSFVDIASLSVIPRTTGGQVYHYFSFSAVSDTAKLYNDLRWNVTRPQGFEAVMRVRCSLGILVHEYSGNICKRIETDVDLPAIDCDKAIMVSLKHDDKLQEGTECSFQCALVYTTIYGQRRIRISTLSLPCTNMISDVFQAADLDTQVACFLKKAANKIPSAPLAQVRDQATNDCINILSSYRKFCATVSYSGKLILPEALKFLPLYTLALLKSSGLCTGGRIDDRSFWINYVSSLRTPLAIPLVYPRMIAVHDLELNEKVFDESGIPITIPLSSEHISDEGIYLLENGEDCLIFVGHSVPQNVLQQLFGFSSVEEISNQFTLEQYDNPLSKKLNTVVNEIRRQRSSYLRLKFCKKGDSSGMMFLSYMVEDQTSSDPSYVDYFLSVHKQIQKKMA